MAYDEDLAERIRRGRADQPSVSERRMFGRPAFLVDGNLAVVASGQGGLMVRLDPEVVDRAVDQGRGALAEMNGRKRRG